MVFGSNFQSGRWGLDTYGSTLNLGLKIVFILEDEWCEKIGDLRKSSKNETRKLKCFKEKILQNDIRLIRLYMNTVRHFEMQDDGCQGSFLALALKNFVYY